MTDKKTEENELSSEDEEYVQTEEDYKAETRRQNASDKSYGTFLFLVI